MSDEQQSCAALDALRAKLRDPEQAGRDLLAGWTASRKRKGSILDRLQGFHYQFTDPDGEVYNNLTPAASAAARRLSQETGFDAALWLAEAAPRTATGRPGECEARRVGEPWRRFASMSDVARAFPELSKPDVARLINKPSKVKVAIRGRFEARKVMEAADEASSSKLATVQLDDDDDAAPWPGPASELDEAPPQDASVATPPASQPVGAVAAPPLAAVAALPFGMGAADARVPFGGALPALLALRVALEVEAACAAPALDETLEAPTWAPPPPPPPPELDAGALALVLEALDEESRQAAAAPAPVVAAPALVSPVAAAASTKRPRDESPKSVAVLCGSYQ